MADNSGPAYETQDVDARRVGWAALGLLLGLALILGATALLLGVFDQRRATGPTLPAATPPQPRLQVDPPVDWQQLEATQSAILNSYGWADAEAGRARIPIERAMTLLLEQGLPVATPNVAATLEAATPEVTPTPGGSTDDGEQ